ncbi:MAG: sporulation integral membrane protein YtvI [Clostridia bacterium]|nr:sporulation integral membrane protein YtvI [Clostridia bacterium]
MKNERRMKILDILLIVALTAVIYFAAEKLFFLLFPIALAFVFSEAIRKSFRRLHPLSPPVKRILIVLILLIFFALLSLLMILLVDQLIHGASSAASYLSQGIGAFTDLCGKGIRSFEGVISHILKRDMENSLTSRLPDLFEGFLQKILEEIPKGIGALVSFVPRFFISLLIFVIATYYFSCDWKRINRSLSRILPTERLEKINGAKERMLQGLIQYGKAYLLLFLLTFSQLFLGLSVLRIQGAASKAFFIALVDLLPIFGCGTVLVPWGIITILVGATGKGVGILVLFIILFVVRQFLEPKVVGDSIGLHPLLSLVLVISGLTLFGILGMILFPLIGTCILESIEEKSI